MLAIRLLLAMLIFSLGIDVSTSLAQSKVTLKLAHNSALIYPYHIGALKLAEEVKRRSNDRMEIQIFPMSQLGNERDLTQGVHLGTIDMIVVSNAMVTNFVPEVVVFDLPYLFRDRDHALRVLQAPIGQRLTKTVEQKVGKVLGYYAGGTRGIYNSVRPVRRVDDLKGLKIRVIPNKIYVSTLNALGALATPMPFSEVYGALQQGVIDGAENDPPSLLGMKHYEVAKHYSLTSHFVQEGYLFINVDRWNSLTAEQQKVLAEAAQISQKEEREYERAKHGETIAELQRLKVEIVEVDQSAFAEKVKPVWREIPSEYAPLIEEIQNVK